MSKLYGSIANRLAEGQIRNKDGLIHEGDDVNMYYWSDVHCYFVTAVENQKRIRVREYSVVADREKEGGMGNQDWAYFKKENELHAYFNKYHLTDVNDKPYDENIPGDPWCHSEEVWVFRYGKWWTEYFDQNGVKHYSRMPNVSIGKGIRSYHYDWEF